MFSTHEAQREEMPDRFLSLLDKTERCVDFESKQPPTWVQIYGCNNTMYVVSDLGELVDLTDEDAPSKINRLLAIITCNQNVVGLGCVFTGIKVEFERGEAEGVNTEEELRRYVEGHDPTDICQVITAGYETRADIYQAHSKVHVPDDEDFGEPSMGDWLYGKATSEELEAAGVKAYSGLRGFFLSGKHIRQFLGKMRP